MDPSAREVTFGCAPFRLHNEPEKSEASSRFIEKTIPQTMRR